MSGPYSKGGPYGGDGGNSFSDDLTTTTGITQIQAWMNSGKGSGGIVEALKVTWNTTGPQPQVLVHGNGGKAPSGPPVSTLNLAAGEAVTSISGRAGEYVDHLTLMTNKGQTLDVGGKGGDAFNVPVVGSASLGGFFGRSGSDLDEVGFYIG